MAIYSSLICDESVYLKICYALFSSFVSWCSAPRNDAAILEIDLFSFKWTQMRSCTCTYINMWRPRPCCPISHKFRPRSMNQLRADKRSDCDIGVKYSSTAFVWLQCVSSSISAAVQPRPQINTRIKKSTLIRKHWPDTSVVGSIQKTEDVTSTGVMKPSGWCHTNMTLIHQSCFSL